MKSGWAKNVDSATGLIYPTQEGNVYIIAYLQSEQYKD